MKNAIALVSLLSLVALSGCLEGGDGSAQPVDSDGSVPAVELTPGFYQFTHRGGALELAVDPDQRAVLDLYDGQDERLGRIHIGAGEMADSLRLDVPAGDLVARIIALEEEEHEETFEEPGSNHTMVATHAIEERPGLRVQSGGRAVDAFWPLGTQFERHVLRNTPLPDDVVSETFGLYVEPLLFNDQPVLDTLNVTLQRAPYRMDVLVSGRVTDLQVSVRGSQGPVYESEPISVGSGGGFLRTIPGTFIHQNVVDGRYDIRLEASGQEGAIILESRSYSRLIATPDVEAEILNDVDPGHDVAFTYGELPSRPVAIEVHPDASVLHFWTEPMAPETEHDMDCEVGEPCSGERIDSEPIRATFTLYAPDDAKLGTFTVESGQRLDVPVDEGGQFVLVRRAGPTWIGADQAPRDFEFHPVEIQHHVVGRSPGTGTQYASERGNLSQTGAVYDVGISMEDPQGADPLGAPLGQPCSTEGTVQLLVDGEGIGFAGDIGGSTLQRVDALLDPHRTTFFADGYNGSCGDIVLDVLTFHR